jgi:hypothetical protein
MKHLALKVRRGAAMAATGLGGMVVSAMAAAQDTDDFATPVVTELTSGKAQIVAIGSAVLVLVAVVALIRHIRAAAR